MDWTLAIERHSTALKRIVAMLVSMARLGASNAFGDRPPLRSASPTTSPPFDGGSEPASPGALPLPHDVGERCQAQRGGVGGCTISDGLSPEEEAHRPTLPRRFHRAVLRLLRPTESAVRRLIVIAARGLVVPPSPPRIRKPAPPSIFLRTGSNGTGILHPGTVYFSAERQRLFGSSAGGKVNCPLRLSLPLFDPPKRPYRRRRPTPTCEPRISSPGPFNRLSPVKIRMSPTPDDRLDAMRLTLRLQALATALDDLPAQARRLARWQANRARDKDRDAGAAFLGHTKWGRGPERSEGVRGSAPTSQTKARLRRLSPLRPGRPPGSLRCPDHEIHHLLTDLHGLAYDVLEHPDTS